MFCACFAAVLINKTEHRHKKEHRTTDSPPKSVVWLKSNKVPVTLCQLGSWAEC